MRQAIACFKLFLFGILCLCTLITQGIAQFIFRKSKLFFIFPTLFHRLTLIIFRIKVTTEGAKTAQDNVVFVGNHISYIDIPVLGAVIQAVFIAKADVRNWPVLGILGKIAGTVFIGRNKSAALDAIDNINTAINQNRPLIIFPEGTSTNGRGVLPFKSSVFELFLNQNLKNKIIIQPFTIKIIAINERPVESPKDYDLYAWYGDMTLPPHLWSIAKSKGAHVSVDFHPTLKARDYKNRKDFALQCQKAVALGLEKS